GQVVRSGSVAELTSTAGSGGDQTLEFSLARSITAAEAEDLPDPLTLRSGATDGHSADVWVYRVEPVATADDLVGLSQWWQRHGVMPARISMADRSLEDVFWEVSP